MQSIYVFDPTVKDTQSRVRGVGRYIQILKENLSQDTVFTSRLSSIPYDSILINPFIKFLKNPVINRRFAKTQIAVIHDLITLKYPQHFPIGFRGRLSIFLNKKALKNYDTVITDSVQSQKDIVNLLHINSRIVKVVYPTLPSAFLNSNFQFPISNQISNPNNQNSKHFENCKLRIENYCLYVGDATWNKNLVNLAKAIKLADITCIFVGKQFDPHTNPNTLLHIEQKDLKDFLKLAEDDKRFILKGFIDDQELVKLYQQAKCNILVSRDEGFGFPYLEASNLKTPSILSNIPVFKEIAEDTALFVDNTNPQDIADKIKELCSNESLKQELGEKAYERSKFFSAEKFKEELNQILDIKGQSSFGRSRNDKNRTGGIKKEEIANS